MLRKTAETALGVTFGKRKEDRETWWWNEKVQESIKQKKKAKKTWDKISRAGEPEPEPSKFLLAPAPNNIFFYI